MTECLFFEAFSESGTRLYLLIFKHFGFPAPGNEKGEKAMNRQ